jgi:hypothetical protein
VTITGFITDEGLPVKLPSGAELKVLTQDEVAYVEDRVKLYTEQNHFTNISDNQGLDVVITQEFFVWRWGHWLSMQKDWYGEPVDENALRRSLNDYSAEIRQMKRSLGIDKPTRDKEKGDDSVPVYLENLRQRAKEFGYTRETQLDKALELFSQLQALVMAHDNMDDIERRETKMTPADIFEWLRDTAFKDYEAIDAHFRSHSQRYWIKAQ